MSTINTYADLQAAIGRWLARADLSSNIPDYISMFEQVANRRLRTRQQEAVVQLTPAPITPVPGGGSSASGAPLPVDYLAWRRVTYLGGSSLATGTGSTAGNIELEYVEPTYMRFRFPVMNNSVGVPQVFCIEDGYLQVPTLDTTPLELNYFQKIPQLNDPSTAGVNWLLSAYPDLYLAGSLHEAQGALVDLEKAAYWKAKRDEMFDEVVTLSNKSRAIGGMRVMGPTP